MEKDKTLNSKELNKLYRKVEEKVSCTCKECGKKASVDASITLTSYPPQYSYHCPHCGHDGYILTSEAHLENITDDISLNGDIRNKTIKNKKDKEYIDFPVAPYALPDVLLALDNEGITQYWVTKEDNDLHIRIEKDYLREKVYKVKFRPLDEEKDTPVSPYNPLDNPWNHYEGTPKSCEECPVYRDFVKGPYVGDSPCTWCPNRQATCVQTTGTVGLNDKIISTDIDDLKANLKK